MMSRQDKLNKLAERPPLEINTKSLEDKLVNVVDAVKDGVQISNLDDLIDILNSIQEFHREIAELKTVANEMKNINFPSSVTVSGISELTDIIKNIPKQTKIINKINNTNVMDEYQAANSDTMDDANKYYGFVHPTGKWYVLWISGSQETRAYKYANGENAYPQNWGQRKRLSYKRFDQVSL